MKKIENRLKEEVEKLSLKFANSEEVRQYEEASTEFEKLVKMGLVQKRGNNLLSPTDAHIKKHIWFNA